MELHPPAHLVSNAEVNRPGAFTVRGMPAELIFLPISHRALRIPGITPAWALLSPLGIVAAA